MKKHFEPEPQRDTSQSCFKRLCGAICFKNTNIDWRPQIHWGGFERELLFVSKSNRCFTSMCSHTCNSRKLRERVLLKNSCSIDHQHDKTIADRQPLTTANDKTIADHQPLTTANDKTIADHQPLTTANDKTIADHQPLTTANDKTMRRCTEKIC